MTAKPSWVRGTPTSRLREKRIERLVGGPHAPVNDNSQQGNVIIVAVSVCLVGGFVGMMAWILR